MVAESRLALFFYAKNRRKTPPPKTFAKKFASGDRWGGSIVQIFFKNYAIGGVGNESK